MPRGRWNPALDSALRAPTPFHAALLVPVLLALLPGCAVVTTTATVTGAVVSAAVGVTTTAVGVTVDAAGAAVDLAVPDDEDEKPQD